MSAFHSRRIGVGLFALLAASFFIQCIDLSSAHAWGRRGHAIVCETAAYLASEETQGEFLKSHSYDLGYYCNAPDFHWKAPETYKVEWTNHFMDMEIFDREMKDSKVESPFAMDRASFDKTFPKIKQEAGRSWWRIRELSERLDTLTQSLKKTDLKTDERFRLQADWLTTAGAIGHYVGDLAQPLHTSENYDGQLSEQKGIHSFFEDKVVDELFLDKKGGFETEVLRKAEASWKKYKAKADKTNLLDLLKEMTTDSAKDLDSLLKIDKKVGRNDIKKAAAAQRDLIIRRLAAGAVVQAEMYRRHLGWDYVGKGFYTFVGTPAFIAPAPSGTQPSELK